MSTQNLVILNQKDLDVPAADLKVGGINVATKPSPYDVPEAVRTYDETDGSHVIEIKYMGPDEPLETVDLGGDVFVRTGRNSNRVYAFILGVKSGSPALNAVKRVLGLMLERDKFSRKDNYRLVGRVFSNANARLDDILAFTNVNKGKK